MSVRWLTFSVALGASVAGCGGQQVPDPERETVQDIELQSIQPAILLPGSKLVVEGARFVPEFGGPTTLRLIGSLDGELTAIELPARFVDYQRMEATWKNYFANNMTSKGSFVVVVGDITQSEVLPKLNFLKNLPAKDLKLPSVSSYPKIDKTKVFLVDVPKAAQTEFRVGTYTGLKFDALGEYYRVARLMNYPLGGSFNSRLNINLREDKGWTYGARSFFSGDKYTGEFAFSSGIRANATDSALVEVMTELTNYYSKGITNDELNFMKSAIGQQDARTFETGFQKANRARHPSPPPAPPR
jgi:hypothetical protein